MTKEKCLFCNQDEKGLEVYPHNDSGPYTVMCLKCGSCGPLRNTKDDAIIAWNEPSRIIIQ